MTNLGSNGQEHAGSRLISTINDHFPRRPFPANCEVASHAINCFVRVADQPLEDPWLGDEVLLVLEDFVVGDDADVAFPGLCFVEELGVGVAEPSDEDGEFRVLESVP